MITYQSDTGVEIVFGLVGAAGVDHQKIVKLLGDRLDKHKYEHEAIRISSNVIPGLAGEADLPEGKYERTIRLIKLGNDLREKYKENGILALAAIAEINRRRKPVEGAYDIGRKAHILSSFKRPEEIAHLRYTYTRGFYLIGVYASPERRYQLLKDQGAGMSESNARDLIKKDENEDNEYGQKTRDTFQLADFFVEENGDEDQLRNSIDRIVDLIFGHPYITPTFDEYAMFLAFSASLRSSDLSRQVGAIIAKDNEIISSGANECPKALGGLYWPEFVKSEKKVCDKSDGRDYMRGFDQNVRSRDELIAELANFVDEDRRADFINNIKESSLRYLTEFGRVVHAEMEAILHCARNTISCRGATLYATTFPCHNCAKHIIAAGISKVIYVEPYPKSKAFDFHKDSITAVDEKDKVYFRPFIGVGPKHFFELFSMNLSSGYKMKRKAEDGTAVGFDYNSSEPRIAMRPFSYLENEEDVIKFIAKPENKPHEETN